MAKTYYNNVRGIRIQNLLILELLSKVYVLDSSLLLSLLCYLDLNLD